MSMADTHAEFQDSYAGAQSDAREEHELSYWEYAKTWVYLLILTGFEVGLVLSGVARPLMVTGLLILTGMKAAFIMATFMHLRFERLGATIVALSPIVFGLILFFGMRLDF